MHLLTGFTECAVVHRERRTLSGDQVLELSEMKILIAKETEVYVYIARG